MLRRTIATHMLLDTLLITTQLTAYFVTLLLAGYILNRSRFHPLAVATAGLLGCYALIQADQFIGKAFTGEWTGLGRALWIVYPLPVALWARIALLLKPDDEHSLMLDRAWWTLLMPIAVVFIFGGWLGDDLLNFGTREAGTLFWTFAVYNVVVTSLTAYLLHRIYQSIAPTDQMRRAFALLRLGGLGFAGSMVLLLLDVLPLDWFYALLVADVVMVGIGGIVYEAIAEGQVIRRDFALTSLKVVVTGVILVAPWGIALLLSDVWTIGLAVALLFSGGMIAFGNPLTEDLERLLDTLLGEDERQTRDALRTLMVNTARRPETSRFARDIDHDEFVRLTRRALSHMPNLPRLAASPLTDMQLINLRVEGDANTLQRANELRLVLAECIDALRPQERGEYGTGDEWRFFNALYYPYVEGISPYKRSLFYDDLEQPIEDVVKWFQTTVPPRTLYNWQNRGAELIADILLEQETQLH